MLCNPSSARAGNKVSSRDEEKWEEERVKKLDFILLAIQNAA